MKIYPAIDIMGGKVVRLAQGQFDQQTFYSVNPLEAARQFAADGAKFLHVVDLDGARQGCQAQLGILKELIGGVALRVQVGGGVRSKDDVARLLDVGADRVVVGSLAVNDPQVMSEILASFGGSRVTLGLDVQWDGSSEPLVAVHGWREVSAISAFDLLEQYLPFGLEQVLCTDIAKDGMMGGPNLLLYERLREKYPKLVFLASGGIRDLGDLRSLRKMGMGGAIIGKALYEGRICLPEALQC